jgi:hypothetical protein
VESTQFDRLARSVGAATTRRTALRGLTAGLLGAIGLGASASEARRRGRRNRGRRCGAQYAGCFDGRDCCDGLICQNLTNPSTQDLFPGTCAYRRGCGKKNDYCDKNRDCCRRFRCQGHECKRRPNS